MVLIQQFKVVAMLLTCLGVCIAKPLAAASLQQAPAWSLCSGAQAAFQVTGIEMEPDATIPRGGSMLLTLTGTNQQQVTAGPGTVTVFYCWGRCWQVLTASDTLCPAPAVTSRQQGSKPLASASSSAYQHVSVVRKLQATPASLDQASDSSDSSNVAQNWLSSNPSSTCTMQPGPLVLKHSATLPAIAPKGSYKMRLSAADVITQQELMCVDVWFSVN